MLTAQRDWERSAPLADRFCLKLKAQEVENIFIQEETVENLDQNKIASTKPEESQEQHYVYQLFIENPSNLLVSRNSLL